MVHREQVTRVTAADSEDGERGMGILVSLPSKPAVFETFETICRQIALIPTATPTGAHSLISLTYL